MNNRTLGAVKGTRAKWAATGTALALVAGLGGFAAQAANAAGEPSFAPWDEENPNPISLTDALVFYKNADFGWVVNTHLSEVTELAYTVADGHSTAGATAYAPSFQLITHSDQKTYARLVWEPYMQADELDPVSGEYTDLQDGLWWTNKIPSGPGSQADPQPLAFFADGGAAGWTNVVAGAIDVHQGSTSETVSTITHVSFNGSAVPLGNPDATPFDSADIDDAVAEATTPLDEQLEGQSGVIRDQAAEIAALKGQLEAKTAKATSLQKQLDAKAAELKSYKATHHTADGTDLRESRALLSAAPVHGRTVGVDLTGTIAKADSVKYQWYLSGKAVDGATKSTYKVPANATKRSVSVKVTGTSGYITFSIHSNTVAAK
ncbi:hypothetical protein [Microbacterium terricola]|uniref:Uncharacterized protein n=1 Tax=Microbacterium terricola TaxID=344163 RepID=A0ABM8DXL2_9MICO|nr:hypothetical protein [Microbacterium terricola]UYK39052.1 hypothetical protein OAU46_10090 [Microbacterium terricola]BDV30240.1 hypothetical protein Microterr_09000 [Microbacterium terricola]